MIQSIPTIPEELTNIAVIGFLIVITILGIYSIVQILDFIWPGSAFDVFVVIVITLLVAGIETINSKSF